MTPREINKGNMSRIALIGLYTTIGYRFALSHKLKELIGKLVEENLLTKYEFAKVKSEVLEIWIDTSPDVAELQVHKMSKTAKGKYLSFTFVMPYHKVMKVEAEWMGVFIDEFFSGLIQVLAPYQVPENEIITICEMVKKEVVGNETYIEKPSRDREFINQLIMKHKKEKV